MRAQDIKQELIDNGFVVLRSSINTNVLEGLRNTASEDAKKVSYNPASKLPRAYSPHVSDYMAVVDHAEALLKQAGAEQLYLTQLLIVPKVSGEKRWDWHRDAEPRAGAPESVFVFYYLQDTYTENGCISVIPRRNDLGQAEVIAVNTGDVIVLDPSLLHCSMANLTQRERLMIRLQIELKWKEIVWTGNVTTLMKDERTTISCAAKTAKAS